MLRVVRSRDMMLASVVAESKPMLAGANMPSAPTVLKQSKPYLFQKGQSGNPAGRQKGSRNKLADDFVNILYDDFKANGRGAIVAVREKDPSTYVKVIAQLLPKEVTMTRPLEGMSDDELIDAIAILQSQIRGAIIEGETSETSADAPPVLQDKP